MKWASAILDLATISIRAFDNAKQRQYQARIKNLRNKIATVEDTDFYNKDMEAKGRAERELMMETLSLKDGIIKDAN